MCLQPLHCKKLSIIEDKGKGGKIAAKAKFISFVSLGAGGAEAVKYGFAGGLWGCTSYCLFSLDYHDREIAFRPQTGCCLISKAVISE